jgi:curved DNA-binding protein CbpA
MMNADTDLYSVLGLSPDASDDEVTAAYYRQVRAHPPEKDQEGFQRVQRAFDVLRDPRSRREYDQERRTDPEVRLLISSGRQLIDAGDPGAVTPLKRALVRQPESVLVRDLFVQALMIAESHDEAEKQVRILIRTAPENPAFHGYLGDILQANGQVAAAEEPYREAIRLDDQSPQPVVRLARLLNSLDRADEAIQLLREAILRDGRVDFEDFLFFKTLCRIYISERRLDLLAETHAEIRRILPPEKETRAFVAWFYYTDALLLTQYGNFDAALAMIDEAFVIDDSLPELRETQSRIRESKSALDQAMRLREDTDVLPELRYTVGPLLITRLIDDDESLKQTFKNAAESLNRLVQSEGAPIPRDIQVIKTRYPDLASVVGDFLDDVLEAFLAAPKKYMNLRCPNCGERSFTEKPTLDSLMAQGLPRPKAQRLLSEDGQVTARSTMRFQCDECGEPFDGNSSSVSRAYNYRPRSEPFLTWPLLKSVLLIGGIVAVVVSTIYCPSPEGSNSRGRPGHTRAPQAQSPKTAERGWAGHREIQCDECGEPFDGNSSSVSRAYNYRPRSEPFLTWPLLKSVLLIGGIVAVVVSTIYCPSPEGSNSRGRPGHTASARATPVPTSTALAAPMGPQRRPPPIKGTRPPATPRPKYQSFHVTSENLNVRSGPGTAYQRIARLSRFSDIEVLEPAADGWSRVRLADGREGFVSATFIERGSGSAARIAWCRLHSGTRPQNGEILEQNRRGAHTLRIKNAPGRDAVVKLKDRSDRTVLSFFVRAGATTAITSVPEGSFKPIVASGNSFSRACGYFLEDLSISELESQATFATTYDQQYRYTTILEYTLFAVSDGNLRPTSASLEDFLDRRD